MTGEPFLCNIVPDVLEEFADGQTMLCLVLFILSKSHQCQMIQLEEIKYLHSN